MKTVSLGHGHEWEQATGPNASRQKKISAAISMRDKHIIEKQQLT
jgi:hypothetical protein